MLRSSALRATVAVLAVFGPGTASAVSGCSSSSGGQGSPDASGSFDASGVQTSDSAAPGEASALDAGSDGQGDEAADAGPGFAEGGNFSGDCGVGGAGEPTDLRCTGLYADFTAKTIATSAVAYDPGLHFWSDGADKSRWIYLPPGQKIDTSVMDEWTFPVGTKVWKEFRLALGGADGGAGDAAAAPETRIETRMLWKQSAGQWYRTTYQWTSDGTSDATELLTGAQNVAGTTYQIPNQYQCNDCHAGRIDDLLGFEAVALSTPAASGLDMQALVSQGLLTAPPASPLVVPGSASDSAVLGWLHVNCGVSCHNRGGGEAASSNFFMRLDVGTLATVQSTDTYTTGWNVVAQNFTIADAGTTYRFQACNTGSSAAYYRADHRDGVGGIPNATQMPPIVTHEVDVADMAALAGWIDEGCDGGH